MNIPPVNRDYAIVVRQDLLDIPSIKCHHVLLYGFLKVLSIQKGYCWISRPALAKRFCTGERNIKYWLAELKRVKAIKIKIVWHPTNGNHKERRIYCLF